MFLIFIVLGVGVVSKPSDTFVTNPNINNSKLTYQNSLNSINSNDSLIERNNTLFLKSSTSVNNENTSKNNLFNLSSTKESGKFVSKKNSDDSDPFENSDNEIEDLDMPMNKFNSPLSGQINTGVGTMVKNATESPPLAFKNKPEPVTAPPITKPYDSFNGKQRNASFIDIAPELFESNKSITKDAQNLKDDLANNNSTLAEKEKKLLELESRIKTLEIEKKKYEMAFNQSDRMLAEREKQISAMNEEKFKVELSSKNDMSELLKEITILKENKFNMENKISTLEHTKSLSKLSSNIQHDVSNDQSESYLIKIKALENHIDDLTNDRKILSQIKLDLSNKIDEYEKAIKIVTSESDNERKLLKDELNKSKKDLNDLLELKKRLQVEIDELKDQLNEKNLNFERINMEKGNFEQRFNREKQDIDKMRSAYEGELNKMRSEQMKLIEKIAASEAKLVSTEKDVEIARAQVQEREKQINELREQLAKSKTEYALHLNLFKQEKEEKENLLRKCELLEDTVKRNMEEVKELKSQSARSLTSIFSPRKQQMSEEADESMKKIEKENKKLQSDVRGLAEKLEKTESQLEVMKTTQAAAVKKAAVQAHFNNIAGLPDAEDVKFMQVSHSPRSSRATSPRKMNNPENDKIKSEIQRLREDFNFIIDKYSYLEQNNSQLTMGLNSLKMQALQTANENFMKREPVDISG